MNELYLIILCKTHKQQKKKMFIVALLVLVALNSHRLNASTQPKAFGTIEVNDPRWVCPPETTPRCIHLFHVGDELSKGLTVFTPYGDTAIYSRSIRAGASKQICQKEVGEDCVMDFGCPVKKFTKEFQKSLETEEEPDISEAAIKMLKIAHMVENSGFNVMCVPNSLKTTEGDGINSPNIPKDKRDIRKYKVFPGIPWNRCVAVHQYKAFFNDKEKFTLVHKDSGIQIKSVPYTSEWWLRKEKYMEYMNNPPELTGKNCNSYIENATLKASKRVKEKFDPIQPHFEHFTNAYPN